MERKLRADKLVETAGRVRRRIEERFADAGLARVAAEIVLITEDAIRRAEAIARPNLWLRAGLVVLLVIAVGGVAAYLQNRDDGKPTWRAALDFLDATKGSTAVLGAAAIFLFTLETRLKRRRALRAVHELRAMAHMLDMHQLAKDPDRLGDPTNPVEVGGRKANADDLGRYLHFCTELLAIVSKIGQLYVQDFPDTTAVNAVDQFESLATGLSNKMWQKIMILDQMRSGTPAPAVGAPAREGERQPQDHSPSQGR
jgi:hypothetical protein